MITRTQRALYLTASLIVVTAMCSGCMPGTSRGPPAGSHPAGQPAAVITVGSFDFPESMVLADIYGDALKAKGFPVRILPVLGSRELVDPALMSGLIQVVPEYAGSALQYLVVLADDRRLQPAENITPLVSRDVVARYGAGVMAVLNTVSARLDTVSLRALDALVELHGQDPRRVAGRWLRAQGLLGQEGADR